MKKMKKALFFVLLIVLSACMLLTSCAGGSDGNDDTTVAADSETTTVSDETTAGDETTMNEETTKNEETTTAKEEDPVEEEVWKVADVEFYSKADELIEPGAGKDWSEFQYWKGVDGTTIWDSHGEGQYVKAKVKCKAFEVWFGNNDQNTHSNVEIYLDGKLIDHLNMREGPGQTWCGGPYYTELGEHEIIVKGGTPIDDTWNGLTFNIIKYSENAEGEPAVNVDYTFIPMYPNGSTKAFTLGFDDGVSNDKKLIDLAAKYGLKCCTFMLNSNNKTNDVKLNVNGFDINVHFYGNNELKDAYVGAEAAGHGMNHASLIKADTDITKEVKGGNDALSKIFGYEVKGFAYPYDERNAETVKELEKLGILYARTCTGTNSAKLPENFLLWNPTAINLEKNIPSIVDKCINDESTELQCIYIWGHAGELDCGDGYSFKGATRWDDMEALLKQVSSSKKFWAATNGQIATYVNAVRGLKYAEDGITNNSTEKVYGTLDGKKIVIQPGETYAVEVKPKDPPKEENNEGNGYGVVDSPLKPSDVGLTLTYPDGNTRAFTLSYDDGCTDDANVIKLCKKYGAKPSFHMLSYWGGNTTTYDRDGQKIEVGSLNSYEVKKTYQGYEVGGHSASHPNLTTKSEAELKVEIEDSNAKISKLVGYTIRGFSYPGNGFNDTVIKHLMNAGIAYARTTNSTYKFTLPKNAYEFMKWNPTCCDQESSAASLVTKCATNSVTDLQCYYVWGHAFDLKKNDPYTKGGATGLRWDDLEAILKAMSDAGNFWCATNIEIRDYVMATYKLYITEDGIENQSDMTVYGVLNGNKVTIEAGKTLGLK